MAVAVIGGTSIGGMLGGTAAMTAAGAAPAPLTTSVLLPSDGATVSEGIFVDAGAQSQAGIASVSFEVSGGSVSNQVVGTGVPTLYGYIGGWNTRDVPNGTYSFQSVATDTTGQSTTSAPITVTVDNPPLSTTVLVPQGGEIVDGTLPGDQLVYDAVASAGATSVTFTSSFGGVLSATPTAFGWLAVTGVPTCFGDCTLGQLGDQVWSTATFADGETVTSPIVSYTLDAYFNLSLCNGQPVCPP